MKRKLLVVFICTHVLSGVFNISPELYAGKENVGVVASFGELKNSVRRLKNRLVRDFKKRSRKEKAAIGVAAVVGGAGTAYLASTAVRIAWALYKKDQETALKLAKDIPAGDWNKLLQFVGAYLKKLSIFIKKIDEESKKRYERAKKRDEKLAPIDLGVLTDALFRATFYISQVSEVKKMTGTEMNPIDVIAAVTRALKEVRESPYKRKETLSEKWVPFVFFGVVYISFKLLSELYAGKENVGIAASFIKFKKKLVNDFKKQSRRKKMAIGAAAVVGGAGTAYLASIAVRIALALYKKDQKTALKLAKDIPAGDWNKLLQFVGGYLKKSSTGITAFMPAWMKRMFPEVDDAEQMRRFMEMVPEGKENEMLYELIKTLPEIKVGA